MIKVLSVETHDKKHGGYHYNILVAECMDDGIRKDITFYVNPKKKTEWGTEVYSGSNYIVGSNSPSYSRNYKHWNDIPDKYLDVALMLSKKYKKIYG